MELQLFILFLIFIIFSMSFKKLKTYFQGGVCKSDASLDGKIVIVTGSTSGIGKETAKDVSRRGAKVILAVRNLKKAENVVKEIIEYSGNGEIFPMQLDLSSFKSVVDFAKRFKEEHNRLDVLINNAGVIFQEHTITEDGFELVWQTNYLGPVLLTFLLLDVLEKTRNSRIVNVSSRMYEHVAAIRFDDINGEKRYGKFEAYNQSKLALVIFTRKLAEVLREDEGGVAVFSLHPGVVMTELFTHLWIFRKFETLRLVCSNIMGFFAKTVEQGAQTTIFCAVEEGIEKYSGGYFSDCEYVADLKPHARDEKMTEELWKYSLEMIKDYYKPKF